MELETTIAKRSARCPSRHPTLKPFWNVSLPSLCNKPTRSSRSAILSECRSRCQNTRVKIAAGILAVGMPAIAGVAITALVAWLLRVDPW